MERKIENLRDQPHWSYSALQCYLTCPMKYKFRYVDNAPVERTCSALPFGRAFHAVLSERAWKGSEFTLEDAKENFAFFFQGETEVSENLVYKPGESFDSCLEKGLDMLKVAYENWSDDYVVKTVAESFKVDVPGLSKPLIGEFDLVVTDGGDEAVCDWKTASSKWPMGKANRDLQATAFCYAYKKIHGKSPLFRFDVYTKTKIPTLNQYYTLRTQDELDRFEFVAGKIEQAVNTELFFPNENLINCAECPYADRCKKSTRKGSEL